MGCVINLSFESNPHSGYRDQFLQEFDCRNEHNPVNSVIFRGVCNYFKLPRILALLCDSVRTHTQPKCSSIHVSNMRTDIRESHYMCRTGRSLKEEPCTCNFADSIRFMVKKKSNKNSVRYDNKRTSVKSQRDWILMSSYRIAREMLLPSTFRVWCISVFCSVQWWKRCSNIPNNTKHLISG